MTFVGATDSRRASERATIGARASPSPRPYGERVGVRGSNTTALRILPPLSLTLSPLKEWGEGKPLTRSSP